MAIIAVFGLFVFIGDVIAVGICTIIEKYSQTGSLFAFLGMFMIVFVIAWQIALRVTERYLVKDKTDTAPAARR